MITPASAVMTPAIGMISQIDRCRPGSEWVIPTEPMCSFTWENCSEASHAVVYAPNA